MIDIDRVADGVARTLLASPAARTGNFHEAIKEAFKRGLVLGDTLRSVLPESPPEVDQVVRTLRRL